MPPQKRCVASSDLPSPQIRVAGIYDRRIINTLPETYDLAPRRSLMRLFPSESGGVNIRTPTKG